jgi:hypothetical protein
MMVVANLLEKAILILLVLLFVVLTTTVKAQQTSAVSVARKEKRFGLDVVLEQSSNLYGWESPNHDYQTNIWLVPQYKLSDSFVVSPLLVATKKYKGEEEFDFTVARLRVLYKTLTINNVVKAKPSVRGFFAINDSQIRREGLNFAVSIDTSFRVAGRVLRSEDLKLQYRPRVYKYSHKHELATTGTPNTSWRLQNRFDLSWEFTKNWQISTAAIFDSRWTYKGNVTESFSIGEELSFILNDHLAFAVGHSNDASVLAANGKDSNIGVFDENTSSVYGSMTYSY